MVDDVIEAGVFGAALEADKGAISFDFDASGTLTFFVYDPT